MNTIGVGNRELVERFLERYRSAETQQAYGSDIRQFLDFMGHKPVSRSTAGDVQRFAAWLSLCRLQRPDDTGPYSAGAVARKLGAAVAFLRWLVAEGVCSISETELQRAGAVRNGHGRMGRRRMKNHQALS